MPKSYLLAGLVYKFHQPFLLLGPKLDPHLSVTFREIVMIPTGRENIAFQNNVFILV
jgi:hypothetical protein